MRSDIVQATFNYATHECVVPDDDDLQFGAVWTCRECSDTWIVGKVMVPGMPDRYFWTQMAVRIMK